MSRKIRKQHDLKENEVPLHTVPKYHCLLWMLNLIQVLIINSVRANLASMRTSCCPRILHMFLHFGQSANRFQTTLRKSMSMSIRRNTYVDVDSSMHCVSNHSFMNSFKRLALCHWSNQAVFDPAMPSPQAGGTGPCPSPQCFSHRESCLTKFTLTYEFVSVTKSPQKPARSTAWDAPYHRSVGGSHARPVKRQQAKHMAGWDIGSSVTPWLDPSLPASSAAAKIAWNLSRLGHRRLEVTESELPSAAEKRMSCGKEGRPTVAGLVFFLGSTAKQASTYHRR